MLKLLHTFAKLSFIVACVVQTATALPIGDLGALSHWTGLTKSDLTTDSGDAAAILSTSGKASYEYSEAQSYLGYLAPSFIEMHDEIAVGDWYSYRYLEFSIYLPDEELVDIVATVFPLRIGRPDFKESLNSKVSVEGKGWHKVVLPLREFNYNRQQGTFWRFIKSLSIEVTPATEDYELEILISQPKLKRSKAVAIRSEIRSKPVKPGEEAIYDLVLENETGIRQHLELIIEKNGYEACKAALSADRLTLGPGESATVQLSVEMDARVAPGGREATKITVIPNGRGDLKETLRFQTVHYLEHPYILHTEAGWQEVIEKTKTVDWAADALDEYVASARNWRVPKISSGNYCYRLHEARNLLTSAIAWKLTGEESFAEKSIQFLREFSDPETGYPTKMRSNSGSKVHQGMFFIEVARAYDLLYNHPSLSREDHAQLERTLRLFSKWVDPALQTGDGNNHQASMVAGAVLNALVLQDFEEVDRYLHGPSGYVDLMGRGILDDGHYFEGTANYNILTGNLANSMVVAFEPWGMNVKDWKIPPAYGKFIMISDWAMRGNFLGMSFERQGPSTRNYRQLKDIWDTVIPMSDYRGVVFPTSDSVGIDLKKGQNEAGFGFDMAYYLWRDPAYVPILKIAEKRDLLYGVVDLPEVSYELGRESYLSENVGFAVLRSKVDGKHPREITQVVQRYGTHGGYHGHFDRTSLASLSRFGRTHYGPEASWYGYGSFMFKMWVQTSSAHNMVVVDHRMQKPGECRNILFHSGEMMQVSATEIETPWIDPPYGGQTPYALKMPEEKSWSEARWLPTPDNPRPQGDTGTPSKPVLQRRLIVVTDDYVVMSDYLRGEETHNFDNLFNCKGLTDLSADTLTHLEHTAQCDPDPYSAAQFITNCDWYATYGDLKASFLLDWAKGEMGGRKSQSEPGVMNLDYYSLWPKDAGLMVGNYAESHNVARRLFYKVIGDGKVLDEGQFAPWILGKAEIDVDVSGVSQLQIETRIEKARALKTIFLGNPQLLNNNGETIELGAARAGNIAAAAGPNLDYAGGKVSIFGQDYATSIPAEPANRKEVGTLTFDLEGRNAARFRATLGGDYPVGGDDIQRKVIATRSRGQEARFLSAIELHEDSPVIDSIQAPDHETIILKLADGRTETLKIINMDGDGTDIKVRMTREQDGQSLVSENTL